MSFCKHFRSMGSFDTCQIGIAYDDVRDTTTRPHQWPCFADGSLHSETVKCEHCVYPTPEEEAAEQAEVNAFIERLRKLDSGELQKCIHCSAPITRLNQVGRSVYARPCGCRQYQGRLPAWARGEDEQTNLPGLYDRPLL